MVLSSLVLQYMLNGTGLPLQLEERSKPICSLLGLTCLLVEVALVNTPSRNIAAQEGWIDTVLATTFALLVSL